MRLNLKMKMTQMLQIHDHDKNEDYFLIEQDGEWLKITEEEYNQQIRGKQ